MDQYDALKLENQLCFPLYAASREIIRYYRPFLDELGLTYTQYIAMLVFWECGETSVRDLGQKLYLDSGTLTPVLKRLESKELIRRHRCAEDERMVIAELTEKGRAMKERALSVPKQVACCVRLSPEEGLILQQLLNKILAK